MPINCWLTKPSLLKNQFSLPFIFACIICFQRFSTLWNMIFNINVDKRIQCTSLTFCRWQWWWSWQLSHPDPNSIWSVPKYTMSVQNGFRTCRCLPRGLLLTAPDRSKKMVTKDLICWSRDLSWIHITWICTVCKNEKYRTITWIRQG